MKKPISSPISPDLRTVLAALKQEIFYTLNCHEVGEIVSFDATSQSASVQVSVLKQIVEGDQYKQVPYPVLADCPVMFLGGGPASLRFPVAKGDPCLVLFNDRDLDNWFTTGNKVMPNSGRAHDLSDGLVIVGFRNKAGLLKNFSTDNAELVLGDFKLSIAPDGTVQLVGKNGTIIQVKNDGTFSMSTTGGVTVNSTSGGKISIANGGGSLKSALDSLCTALTSWIDTRGDTPNPATVAAINAAKTNIDNLLA